MSSEYSSLATRHSPFKLGPHLAPVYALARGASDEWLFTGGGDRVVPLWNIQSGQQEPFLVRTEAPVYALHFDPKTEVLFIGCSNGMLHAIDTRTKVERKAWSLDSNGLFDIKPDEARNRVLVCGGNGVLTVIEAETLEVLRSIPLSEGKLRRIALRGEGDLVAIADNSGLVHVLDAESYQTVETIRAHHEGSTAVAWHPSKPVLVTGGKDAYIRCWNMNEGYRQVLYLAAHQSAIYDIVYLAQQNCFVSCSRDKTIKWWDPNLFDPLGKVDYSEGGHKHSVNRLLILGNRVVSASDDRNVLVFGV